MSDPTALPNFPPPADEHPLRGLVLDALQDQGLGPDIDKDGDVAFKVQDQQMFVRCTEGDFQIMRVFGQWQLAEPVPDDRAAQLGTCNELNLNLNLVKTALANGTLVVTSEHLVTSREAVPAMVQMSIQIVLATVQMWHQKITGIGPDGTRPAASDEQATGGEPADE